MPKIPKRLLDLQDRLFEEGAQYAAECDQDASEALYVAWMDTLIERVPAESDTDEQAEANDRQVFAALAHLIGNWLAAKHCDDCRKEWATRLALVADRIGCVTAAMSAPAPDDAVRH